MTKNNQRVVKDEAAIKLIKAFIHVYNCQVKTDLGCWSWANGKVKFTFWSDVFIHS